MDGLLHHTAENANQGKAPFFYRLQAAQMAKETVICLGTDTAGIKQYQLGIIDLRRLDKAHLFKDTGRYFAVMVILLASEGPDVIAGSPAVFL